ncbi:MAG: putative glycoside hydrolase [Candidatus Gracilibacteria bacterium]
MKFLQFLALIPFAFFGTQQAPADIAPEIAAPLHGIYITSQNASNTGGGLIMDEFAKIGGNFIVFDIQDSDGKLAYLSNAQISHEIGNRKNQIPDLAAAINTMHEKGFYVAVRFVLFKNGFLAARKPEWTLKAKGTNSPFVSRDGPIWLDPGNPELKAYLTEISQEIALAGADEIQFDYVRFPEGGKGGYVGYSFIDDATLTRDQTLTNAVAEIANEIHYLGVKVGVDIFGIVVWDNVSWKVIGQNIAELAKYVDVLYPMPYPSHFGPGWGGHANPADEPYFFVQETTKKFVEQTMGTGVKIRPWLQGFAMRVTNYGSNYTREQVRALNDMGLDEFVVWNAANNYGIVFGGLK